MVTNGSETEPIILTGEHELDTTSDVGRALLIFKQLGILELTNGDWAAVTESNSGGSRRRVIVHPAGQKVNAAEQLNLEVEYFHDNVNAAIYKTTYVNRGRISRMAVTSDMGFDGNNPTRWSNISMSSIGQLDNGWINTEQNGLITYVRYKRLSGPDANVFESQGTEKVDEALLQMGNLLGISPEMMISRTNCHPDQLAVALMAADKRNRSVTPDMLAAATGEDRLKRGRRLTEAERNAPRPQMRDLMEAIKHSGSELSRALVSLNMAEVQRILGREGIDLRPQTRELSVEDCVSDWIPSSGVVTEEEERTGLRCVRLPKGMTLDDVLDGRIEFMWVSQQNPFEEVDDDRRVGSLIAVVSVPDAQGYNRQVVLNAFFDKDPPVLDGFTGTMIDEAAFSSIEDGVARKIWFGGADGDSDIDARAASINLYRALPIQPAGRHLYKPTLHDPNQIIAVWETGLADEEEK